MSFFRKPHDWKKNKHIQLLIYAIFGVALYLFLLEHVLPEKVELKIGEVSPVTISSPATKTDEYATQKARQQASEAVEPQYTIDETITNRQIEKIDRFFVTIRRNISDKSLSEAEKIANLKDALSNQLPQEFYLRLVRTPIEQITELRLQTREIVKSILGTGVRKKELDEQKDLVDQSLVASTLNSNARYIVRELARFCIIPNEMYDENKTKTLKQAAMETVEPIPIKKGQIIVSEREVVTEDQFRKLQELGLIQEKTHVLPYIGLGLLCLLVLVAFYFYTDRFERIMQNDNSKLIVLFSSLLLTMILMKMVTLGQNLDWDHEFDWNILGYIAPVALGPMLVTLFLNAEIGLVCVVFLGILSGVFFHGDDQILFDFRFGLVAIANGLASVFSLVKLRNRKAVIKAGLMASLASALTIFVVSLLLGNLDDIFWWSTLFGLCSGFLAIGVIACILYFESTFGLQSPFRFIELEKTDQFLLQQLTHKASGTYTHSRNVADLAKAAAEAIGADGLLARVGALYHDIGKTKRPMYFIENQFGGKNPHDDLPPNLSKSIIISHAKDGVKILREHNFPQPILDIAEQHHGTTLLKYFYYKALEEGDGSQVLEEDYRYPGPKAQFKEAAIVGIADSVDAASRTLAKPTPTRIENLVRKIIQERLEDGQFDECDLTFKELDLIAKAMCATLQGISHSRIEYPEGPVKKGNKRR